MWKRKEKKHDCPDWGVAYRELSEDVQLTSRARREHAESPRETVVGLVRFVDDQRRFDLCGKALENTRFS
jgi:hypothetical protein